MEATGVAQRYIEIGFPKTGTTSLSRAMSMLGFRATHTLIEECNRPWAKRTPAARDLFAKWLSGRVDFDALARWDYVGSLFFPIFDRIDRENPGSRFILTVRDPASWLVSMRRFQERYRFRDVSGPLELNLGMVIRIQLLGCLITADDGKMLDAYESHNERVRRHFAGTDRLLVMDVCAGEGWEVLCPFVGRPVPAAKFPHENRTAAGDGPADAGKGHGPVRRGTARGKAAGKGLRILLVRTTPPGTRAKGYVPPVLAPPLGILQLSSFLGRHRPSDEVTIVDAGISLARYEDLAPIVSDLDPHVVGLSGLSLEIEHVRGLARAVRGVRPDVPMIAGGPVASAFPLGLLEHLPEIDAAALGEGERTMVDIANRIESGTGLEDVPGLALRRGDGTPYRTAKRGMMMDLGELPPIDWSAVDIKAYNEAMNVAHTPLDPGGCAILMSTRGCPYDCIYCHKFFGRKVREIRPAAVVDLMEMAVRDHGIRDFHFMDDIFNFRPGRVLEMCEQIGRHGLDVRYAFPNGLRGDLLAADDIGALASTGAYSVTMSVETASPRLQRMIGKRLDLDRTFENAALCSASGILTRGFAMIGFPTETIDEMRATVDRMVESGFDTAMFFHVTPYPGTKLFDLAVENGLDPERWSNLEFKYDNDLVNASSIPDEDLRNIRREAWQEFYSIPSRRQRLVAWVESHGFCDHPYVRGTPFWRFVMDKAAPASLQALSGLAQGMDVGMGWRIETMGISRSGTTEIGLLSEGGAGYSLFVEPRDESRGCMIRTARWNVGLITDSQIEGLPPGLEDAIKNLAGRLDG